MATDYCIYMKYSSIFIHFGRYYLPIDLIYTWTSSETVYDWNMYELLLFMKYYKYYEYIACFRVQSWRATSFDQHRSRRRSLPVRNSQTHDRGGTLVACSPVDFCRGDGMGAPRAERIRRRRLPRCHEGRRQIRHRQCRVQGNRLSQYRKR